MLEIFDFSEEKIVNEKNNTNRSTGPRTAAGKKRSSMNALKHGMYSKKESQIQEEYKALVKDMEKLFKKIHQI